MIKKNCKQCGKEFILSDSEIKFFKDKNLELPKRCSECRNKNKSNTNNNISTTENINVSKSNKKKTTLRSTLAIFLVLVFLLIGKFFNITPNLEDLGISIENSKNNISLEFRNDDLLESHFLKHGSEFDYTSKQQYVDGANKVINSPYSKHKKEAEDGDDIYYDESKNEIVFVSSDGYIRTYFKPSEGIKYFNKQ